jgi:hypothetical protein
MGVTMMHEDLGVSIAEESAIDEMSRLAPSKALPLSLLP